MIFEQHYLECLSSRAVQSAGAIRMLTVKVDTTAVLSDTIVPHILTRGFT